VSSSWRAAFWADASASGRCGSWSIVWETTIGGWGRRTIREVNFKNINKTLVDVTGIEPVTPCLQSKIFASRKTSQFSDRPDNKAFRFHSRMCAAVSGYVRLIIGSLQKSLQCIAPPGDAFLRQSTSIIAEQVDRFFVRNCFGIAQSLGASANYP
jgi:hypothetical protein